MARGPSGRLVLEVDPELKRHLHAQVALEGKTLKDWFLEAADAYLAEAERKRPGGLADRVSEPAGAYRRQRRQRPRRGKITTLSVRGGRK